MTPLFGTSGRSVIALGSNLGDRVGTLKLAVRQIDSIDGLSVTAVSGLVESHAVKPAGMDAAAPDYLNAVALVHGALEPGRLLAELNRIESELGRIRAERWGDRTLDLDIIAMADERGSDVQSFTESLAVPHPRAWQRPFVLVPWLQVEPDAELPGRGRIDGLAASSSPEVWHFDADPLWGTRET